MFRPVQVHRRRGAQGLTVRRAMGWAALGLSLAGCLPREIATEIKLRTTALAVTATCPKMLDSETQMVKVTGTGRTLTYDYLLIHVQQADDSLDERIHALRPGMLERNCANKDIQREFMSRGVVLVHRYNDVNSKFVAEIRLAPEDCVDKEMDPSEAVGS